MRDTVTRYCNQLGCGGSGYNNNIERICASGDADCPGHSNARCMDECATAGERGQQCGAIYWDALHGCGLYDQCLPKGSDNKGTAFSVRGEGSGSQNEDWFGYSVSLSGDLLAVGAPRAFRLQQPGGRGAAYVFRTGDGGTTWTRTGRFAERVDGCSNGAEAFARSVSVGGSVVVVSDEDHDEASGAACVYRTTDGGDTWNHSTTLML